MTTERVASSLSVAAGGVTGLLIGLPNPIAAAVYALIASVVGWFTAQLLNLLKKKLGL